MSVSDEKSGHSLGTSEERSYADNIDVFESENNVETGEGRRRIVVMKSSKQIKEIHTVLWDRFVYIFVCTKRLEFSLFLL